MGKRGELAERATLVRTLARNDFKTKYAGSVFGIFWAFVQPVITILLYWFVFEKGLRSTGSSTVPFVLWLVAGMVPWFFFSDCLNGGSEALISYKYLVKNVVFRVEVLPLVKMFATCYVHAFFVVFTIFLYACYHLFSGIYILQLLYYSLCVFFLSFGIVYMTAAVEVFFRDLRQIIVIILQIGMWLTPIMWNFDAMGLTGALRVLFMANPMFYIVQGYRDSLIDHIWFWERGGMTLYFWVFTLIFIALGTTIFRRLKPHFADVL